jgi:hypothetical protein
MISIYLLLTLKAILMWQMEMRISAQEQLAVMKAGRNMKNRAKMRQVLLILGMILNYLTGLYKCSK